MSHEFIPKSYLYLRANYTFGIFKKDLLAGLALGILALPLAMAFAIASGVSPEKGLFTAIVAGFLISALGGSRVQVGGPTGAFVVIVYAIVQRTGYEGLAISTLIASVILVLLGISRLGSWIKYVPHPLTAGITTGIAVIVFSSQMKDFFGLSMGTPPSGFLLKWIAYFRAFPTFAPQSTCVAFATLAGILLIRRFFPKIPWGVTIIALVTFICWFFHLPVQTIQSRFGELPHNLPVAKLPNLSLLLSKFPELFADGCVIALLGAIESLLCCVIADGMIGGRHKSNCELVGQGIANFASILFGGIPATGAIARTAANVKMGAQTPVAGMIHAAVLFLVIFFLSPIVSQVPLASLAAVLIMVAWNMSELKHFLHLCKAPIGDTFVLLVTFTLTVFVDITIAIFFGMIIASFNFMQQMSKFSKAIPLTDVFREGKGEFPERSDPETISKKEIPPGVEVYEIQGPFFFGTADILKDLIKTITLKPKIFILRMRSVPMIDISGMNALKEFYQNCHSSHVHLLLSGVSAKLKTEFNRLGLTRLIGDDHIFLHIDDALTKAKILSENSRST